MFLELRKCHIIMLKCYCMYIILLYCVICDLVISMLTLILVSFTLHHHLSLLLFWWWVFGDVEEEPQGQQYRLGRSSLLRHGNIDVISCMVEVGILRKETSCTETKLPVHIHIQCKHVQQLLVFWFALSSLNTYAVMSSG